MTPLLATLATLVGLAAFLWLAILLVPWQPWRNDIVLPLAPPHEPGGAADLADVTVVIPARDEVAIIGRTLAALADQEGGLRVILVDDNSTDGTADAARAVPGLELTVVQGEPLPEGWAGKPWALHQGICRVETPITLMIDADIGLGRGTVAALKAQMARGGYQLVSVMASLSMRTFWEKLLAPSFIYFFKMLYPFRLARTNNPHFYSAAGGCIMLETRVLHSIGGLTSIRGELIDDCALARQVKRAGFRTWIGQSRAVWSLRPYPRLADIWNMVARSAFTQLRYSLVILMLTSFSLLILFLAPLGGLLAPQSAVRAAAAVACAAMVASYVPTLLFYGLSPLWAALMPLVGVFYLGMTWTSALRYWTGVRSRWKGRVYR